MKGRITESAHRKRIAFMFGLFLLFLGAVEIRLYGLQCLSYNKYQKEASDQHIKKVSFEPERGWIYDRNGNPLATSVDFSALIASPKDIALQKLAAEKQKKSVKKDLDSKLAKDLSPIIGMSYRELLDVLTQDTTKAWLVLKKEITVEQSEEVEKILAKYNIRNELTLEPVSKRLYPEGDLACHVLGPVGLGNPDVAGNGWSANRALGGLEITKQNQLVGNFSSASSLQDRNGRLLTPMDDNLFMFLSGNHLNLTIDETIQHVTETELENAINQYKAKDGCAIVMDPVTGEILAMASYPKYNPGDFKHVKKEDWKRVSVNRVVEMVFEPGSTFKIFTAAAALEENKVKVTDTFDGNHGKIMFAGKVLRDSHPYGVLTVPQIIEVSSNIGIHQVAQKLGATLMHDYIKKFGFGSTTGIDLPGETPGLIPSLSVMKPLVLSRVSFGQSISVSILQLATAVSAIANGGILMKPHIVKSITDSQGKLIKQYNPEEVRRVISKKTATTMGEIMEGVVLRGTGKGAAIPNYRVAGKTGTAQVVIEGGRGYKKGKYFSSFIGFLPVESPRLVIGVFLNEPSQGGYYGGTVATPAFKNIAEASLSQLKIHLKMPEDTQVAVIPRTENKSVFNPNIVKPANYKTIPKDVEQNDKGIQALQTDLKIMPNLKGLTKRAAILLLAQRELKVSWNGSGVVIEQSPKAGTSLNPGDICQVNLGSGGSNNYSSGKPLVSE